MNNIFFQISNPDFFVICRPPDRGSDFFRNTPHVFKEFSIGINFYVSDTGRGRVQKISETGEFILEFKNGHADRPLRNPFGVACNESKVFISEPSEARISTFDIFGNFVDAFGDDYLARPRHLSYHEARNSLIISDEKKGVYIVNLDNKERTHINSYRIDNEETRPLNRPYSASLDFYDNLYIANHGSHEILQFSPEKFSYSNLDLWVERIDTRKFPIIGVWVSVKDNQGSYLKDLHDESFSIIENDANVGPLSTSYLKEFDDQATWVIYLSRSRYMKPYQDSLNWLTDFFLKNLRELDKVKLVTYSSTFKDSSEFTNSRLNLRKALHSRAVDEMNSNEVTAMNRGLYHTIGQLIPEKGKKSIILVTAGEVYSPLDGSFSTAKLEAYAHNNHIPVFVISFENPEIAGMKEKKKVLEELAVKTGGRYYGAYHSNLNTIDSEMRNAPQNQYVLVYRSGADTEWEKQYMDIKVKAEFQGRTAVETSGYFIPDEK